MIELLDGLSGTGLLVGLEVALVVVALIITPRNRPPSSALAWVLLMAVLPLVGILLFVLIGSPRLPQRRRDKQQDMDKLIEEARNTLSQRTFERVRRIELALGIAPSHYEPAEPTEKRETIQV